MIQQISVFLENKPGGLKKIIAILKMHSINIRATVIHDRGDFGIVQFLVSDPVKAQWSLSEAGLAAAIKPVIAVIINDEPGSLLGITELLDINHINVKDAYGFVLEQRKKAVFCIEVEKPEETEEFLKTNGINMLTPEELYEF
ncbi:MAG: hypothetical protein JNL74_03730 [Fibrobacteres bacterium]|nr:hypothetical protein [Fibrobacterota bacterium]